MGTNSSAEDNEKVLELLCERVTRLLEIQSSTFDQTRQNSAAIITLLAVFLPFFLSGLDDVLLWVKYISILPTSLILIAIFLFLLIFKTQRIDSGIGTHKFDELINKPYREVRLYDLGAIVGSYNDNKAIVSYIQGMYSIALNITYVAILASAIVLLISKFNDIPDKTIEVHLNK
jgi:hypothetical protein